VLESQLPKIKNLKNDSSAGTDAHETRQRKGLEQIFAFYAKQQSKLGNAMTFSDMENDIHLWSIGTFNKFLIDFGITGKP
jgi:hypothetical protein